MAPESIGVSSGKNFSWFDLINIIPVNLIAG
jgi:hypothetical protein